jgi:hypothetical protein
VTPRHTVGLSRPRSNSAPIRPPHIVGEGMTRDEILTALTNETGGPLVQLSWWGPTLAALVDPKILQVVLWVVRQAGKSTFLATIAILTLLTVPGAYVVFIAASEPQAQSIFHRKIRRVLERLLRALGADRRSLLITKRSIEFPEIGSKLEVLATDERTVPGRSVSLLIIDEARDIPDDVYTALAPAVIGGNGKLLIGSTAGRPSGFFYELVRNPLPETWIYYSRDNENPNADAGLVGFLKRQLALISPTAARRELSNEFTEDGDSFLASALIEAAIDDDLGEWPGSPLPAFAFYDLSRKRDLTSRVVVTRSAPRRPEVYDHLVVASLQVWDPKKSATGQVDFAEVRADLGRLVERFPRLERVFCDEGAEGGTLIPWAKAQPALALKMAGFVATPTSNMELWGALVARLHAQTLSIPRHARLIAELRNLRQESFAFGGKWRIVDAGRKYHRDVSLALAGACHAAGYRGYPAIGATLESMAHDDEPELVAPVAAGFFGRVPPSLAEARARAAAAPIDEEPRSGRGSLRFWH